MKKVAITLILSVFGFAAPRAYSTPQEVETFDRYVQAATKYQSQGNCEAATQAYESALALGAGVPDLKARIPAVQVSLAKSLLQGEKFAYALEVAERAGQAYRADSTDVEGSAEALCVLADAREHMNSSDDAVTALYQEAIKIVENKFGKESIKLAPILARYALDQNQLLPEWRKEDPEALIDRAMKIIDAQESLDSWGNPIPRAPSLDIAYVLEVKSRICLDRMIPKYHEATAFAREALRVTAQVVPANSVQLASAWALYGSACLKAKDFGEAMRAAENAEAIFAKNGIKREPKEADLRSRIVQAMRSDSRAKQKE